MTWLPNALTTLRILLLPLLIILMATVADRADAGPATDPTTWPPDRLALVGLFLLMAATDWVDGYLARRLQATTRWGSTADAIADRLVLLLPLLYVAINEPAGFPDVPLWIPLWLLGLDAVTTAAWLVARRRYGARRPMTHNLPGQAGIWLLFALVLWVMADLDGGVVVPLALAGLVLVSSSAAVYLRRWFSESSDAPR